MTIPCSFMWNFFFKKNSLVYFMGVKEKEKDLFSSLRSLPKCPQQLELDGAGPKLDGRVSCVTVTSWGTWRKETGIQSGLEPKHSKMWGELPKRHHNHYTECPLPDMQFLLHPMIFDSVYFHFFRIDLLLLKFFTDS